MTVLAAAEHTRLGTSVHLLVTEPSLLDAAEALVLDGLDRLDRACSRFRPDAELTRCGPEPRKVSPLLADVMRAALDTAAATEGLVDPTLGAALCDYGYDRTFSAVAPEGPACLTLPVHGRWRDVVLDGDLLSVPAGVLLDLGASAKAWAADRLAAEVAALGTGVLVNLGGDLAVAGAPPEGGWVVDVRDRPEGPLVATVALDAGGLATSSTTVRRWRRGGVPVHHVIDPRTGRPAPSDWASVTVAAPSCLQANAVSTAAVVLGAAAPAWIQDQGFPACLQGTDGSLVTVGGWP